MIKILFLCHGNICRSPMAEFIMKDLVKKAGLEQSIQIESAATSTEEIGNPVYPPARRKLSEHGIDCSGKRARQLLNGDYEKYDLLIGMDHANLRSMYRICGGDFADKMHLLMDFTNRPGEVADPWYTGISIRPGGMWRKAARDFFKKSSTRRCKCVDKLVVRGTEISVQWNSSRDDFISLTDIAKLKDRTTPDTLFKTGFATGIRLSFLVSGSPFTTRNLTVSNSMRLGVRPV